MLAFNHLDAAHVGAAHQLWRSAHFVSLPVVLVLTYLQRIAILPTSVSLPSVEIVCVSARTDPTSIIQEIEAPNPTSSNSYYVDSPCLNPRIKPHWHQKNSPLCEARWSHCRTPLPALRKNTHGWLPTATSIRRAYLVSQGGCRGNLLIPLLSKRSGKPIHLGWNTTHGFGKV